LLTASTSGEERSNIIEGLKNGSVSLIVGTHALFSADVLFNELRFILIDEQHRFGVEQRATMTAKGVEPHVLFLSATPIPRTLGSIDLWRFGDDRFGGKASRKASHQDPIGCRQINSPTCWSFLRKEVEAGNQIYWVVPRIAASSLPSKVAQEKGSDPEEVAAVESTSSVKGPLENGRVEAVHGRMSSVDREKSIVSFPERGMSSAGSNHG